MRSRAPAAPWGTMLVLVGVALAGFLFLLQVWRTDDKPRDAAAPERAPSLPSTTSTSSSVPPAQRPDLPPAGKAFFGVTTQSATLAPAELAAFTEAAGRQPNLLLVSVGWAFGGFDRSLLEGIAAAGMVPMVAWEPWDYRASPTDQPDYRLERITAGAFDDYIEAWARGARDYGGPIVLRFAHEMNGNWYPWAEAVNGNHPGDFVAAWRHVHGIFDSVGASNVLWVWSPNITYYYSRPLEPLYPGDDLVDWVGIVGYYGQGRAPGNAWRDFNEIYGSTIDEIRAFTPKPILLTEVGATEVGGNKARWITNFFNEMARHPDIIGFVWYERIKETDWRIVSSEGARLAFAAGASDPRYAWSP